MRPPSWARRKGFSPCGSRTWTSPRRSPSSTRWSSERETASSDTSLPPPPTLPPCRGGCSTTSAGRRTGSGLCGPRASSRRLPRRCAPSPSREMPCSSSRPSTTRSSPTSRKTAARSSPRRSSTRTAATAWISTTSSARSQITGSSSSCCATRTTPWGAPGRAASSSAWRKSAGATA